MYKKIVGHVVPTRFLSYYAFKSNIKLHLCGPKHFSKTKSSVVDTTETLIMHVCMNTA